MKAKHYILIAVVLGGLAYVFFTKDSGHKQEVDRLHGLIKKERLKRDSAESVLTATQDSLKIAFETIRQAHAATQAAKKETEIAQRKYEKIVHVRYATDMQRDSILTSLYPSFRLR